MVEAERGQTQEGEGVGDVGHDRFEAFHQHDQHAFRHGAATIASPGMGKHGGERNGNRQQCDGIHRGSVRIAPGSGQQPKIQQ